MPSALRLCLLPLALLLSACERTPAPAEPGEALSGGATTVREFLDADLIDTLHVVVSPTVTLGEGSRLWESPDELLDRYHCDVVPSSSGVIHHLFWRR